MKVFIRERLNGYYGVSQFTVRPRSWCSSRRRPRGKLRLHLRGPSPAAPSRLPAPAAPRQVANTLASLPFIFLIAVVSTICVYWCAAEQQLRCCVRGWAPGQAAARPTC